MICDLVDSIRRSFQQSPFGFFTEHDLHSELYRIVDELLSRSGLISAVTLDGFTVKLVHHEYPTPFRCDMRGGRFQVKKDHERTERGRGFRRGQLDLVVFNPAFISRNSLALVTGKNYQILQETLRRRQPTVLNLALEVAYFPVVKRIPEIAPVMVKQDYDKLLALRNHLLSGNNPYCQEATMLVFTNHKVEEYQRLKSKLQMLELSPDLPLYFITKDEAMRIRK